MLIAHTLVGLITLCAVTQGAFALGCALLDYPGRYWLGALLVSAYAAASVVATLIG